MFPSGPVVSGGPQHVLVTGLECHGSQQQLEELLPGEASEMQCFCPACLELRLTEPGFATQVF